MTTTTDQTFPLTGPIEVNVRFGHGSVTLRATDGLEAARVRLTARDDRSDIVARVAVELRGSTLAVVAPRQGALPDLLSGRRRDHDAVDAVIDVPSGTPARILTASAPITVTGRCGTADLTTGAADVAVAEVDGDLRVRTGSGNGRIGTVRGRVTVRTGAGDMIIGDAHGDVQCGFGSGDLEIGAARGAVRSRSGAGRAHIGAAFGDVDLAAGAGAIGVGVPAGVSARLDVTSGSGRVESDLPVGDSPATGARIAVRARTGSGGVRLFRADAA